MMANSTGIQIQQSPSTTLMIVLTTTNPAMIPATPESELERGMQMLSDLMTVSAGNITWHAYWPSLLAVPCAIVPLAIVAKGSDQAAEHAACCPTQAGFMDQCEASDCQGDEREGSGGEHGSVSG